MHRIHDPTGAPHAATGSRPYDPPRISAEDVARAARELVAAYGHAAGDLMRRRMRAVRRRGDAETASLWHAVAQAVERELGSGGAAE